MLEMFQVLGLAAAVFRKVCFKRRKKKEAAWSNKSQSTISRSVQQNTLLSELSPSAAARQRAKTCSCGMGLFRKISGEIKKNRPASRLRQRAGYRRRVRSTCGNSIGICWGVSMGLSQTIPRTSFLPLALRGNSKPRPAAWDQLA